MLKFVWDEKKAAVNANKHDVLFEEAATVFADPLSMTIEDRAHSTGEVRLATLGMSISGRMLVVVHVDRGDDLRIISARRATAREKRSYHGEDEK